MFALEKPVQILLLAITSVLAVYFLRLDPLMLLPAQVLSLLFAIVLCAHLLIGRLSRWRIHFHKVAVSAGIPFLCLLAFTFTDLHFWFSDERVAKKYVENAGPVLDHLRSVNGFYPESLENIPSLRSLPCRLVY